jgi:hypothetical protein
VQVLSGYPTRGNFMRYRPNTYHSHVQHQQLRPHRRR